MAKLADAADLKSAGAKALWGFDSPSRHQHLRKTFRLRNALDSICDSRSDPIESHTKNSYFMSKLRVQSFSISLDGFGTGPQQDINNPLGVGGMALHQWAFATRFFHQMQGKEGGASGIDDDFITRGFANVGAWILGRNMFGPVRGPWPDDAWKGWWGDTPPYHTPVFVLTHHPRASLAMSGGTTFHFVTGGIHAALERATDAANGQDVRLGGGVATIRQYLRAGLIDEMHLAMSPVLLGSGENLLEGINMPNLNYQCSERVNSPSATHFIIAKRI